jgi:hypothetical protein
VPPVDESLGSTTLVWAAGPAAIGITGGSRPDAVTAAAAAAITRPVRMRAPARRRRLVRLIRILIPYRFPSIVVRRRCLMSAEVPRPRLCAARDFEA